MGFFIVPYPNAYGKENDRYAFTDPVSGERIEYIAGQDGVDEHWIEIVKMEDRKWNNAERNAKRLKRKRSSSVRTRSVIPLEELGIRDYSYMEQFEDPRSDPEMLFFDRIDQDSFESRYREALLLLNEAQLQTWQMYAHQGLSVSQIAARLGESEGTVSQRLWRIRKKLKKIFKNP